ncbi:hypothetical protein NIES37_19130 [Tolypothrix tenuis PCC 7101]|uniref:Uncharacterized protein n=1 Tax=Tolypothrix tenuis PCC 7101 TaxID=231146 RepID=A0A1Z4MWW0_9CYAN|nr:hypothetical protein NIES37_19130 [Tolypothrix tenuis PCC 7101]BAZ71528.1 hypothetical protein NIES50_00710 [Aulosira laxa NIES-50]
MPYLLNIGRVSSNHKVTSKTCGTYALANNLVTYIHPFIFARIYKL